MNNDVPAPTSDPSSTLATGPAHDWLNLPTVTPAGPQSITPEYVSGINHVSAGFEQLLVDAYKIMKHTEDSDEARDEALKEARVTLSWKEQVLKKLDFSARDNLVARLVGSDPSCMMRVSEYAKVRGRKPNSTIKNIKNMRDRLQKAANAKSGACKTHGDMRRRAKLRRSGAHATAELYHPAPAGLEQICEWTYDGQPPVDASGYQTSTNAHGYQTPADDNVYQHSQDANGYQYPAESAAYSYGISPVSQPQYEDDEYVFQQI